MALCVLLVACLPGLAAAQQWTQFRGSLGNGISLDKGLPENWSADNNIRWKVRLPGIAWSQPVVWGDKIFVTTAQTDKEEKPRAGDWSPGGGFGPPGGRFPGRVGPGGPGPGDGPGGRPFPKPDRRPDRGARPDGSDAKPSAEGGRPGRGGFGFGGDPPDVVYRWKVLCLDAATGKVLWEQTAHEGKPRTAKNRSNSYASETPATDGERLIAYFGMTGLYCYDLDGRLFWSQDLGAFPMQMGWGSGSSPIHPATNT
jgi:outer membrane protein assembly factor BamB